MKAESVVFAIAGMLFGLIVGWIIGDQQARSARPVPAPAQSAAPAAQKPGPRPLDETKVRALTTITQNDPKNAEARAQLGNLYFDAELFPDAIRWYEESLTLDPKNVDVSTDLGVSYYYANQADRALEQFDTSLRLQPNHSKTLLNQGIVRAFGKRDLQGAAESWQKLLEVSPNSPEAQAARQGLDGLKAAQANAGPSGG